MEKICHLHIINLIRSKKTSIWEVVMLPIFFWQEIGTAMQWWKCSHTFRLQNDTNMKSMEQIVVVVILLVLWKKGQRSIIQICFKTGNSLILSIQPHVFLTGLPVTNACRIRRGNFYFYRGMTPPPKSVCKTKLSRSRLKPTTKADLGERRGAFTVRVRSTWGLKG